MKYSKKMYAHDKVIVALNDAIQKYLNYETSVNADLIGNVCGRCHDTNV